MVVVLKAVSQRCPTDDARSEALKGNLMSALSVPYSSTIFPQNAAEKFAFVGHTTAEWATAVSVFAIGGPFGAILAGRVSNTRGRRGALFIDACIYLVGGTLFTFAPSMLWIIFARLIIGSAAG